MKKHLILSLTLISAGTMFAAEVDKDGKVRGDDVSGHTFFSVRPEFQSAFPELVTMFRDRAQARCDGSGGAFQLVGFGGRSTKSKDLMQFFGPCPKSELVVDSQGTTVDGGDIQTDINRDINPLHFGINATAGDARFKSTIQFRPRRTVYGVGISWKHYLGRACDPADKEWWVELNVPIIHVRNKMRLEETIDTAVTTNVAAGIQNMIEAFKGETNILGTGTVMQFGRINDESKSGMSKTGTDIELKFGRDIYSDECIHVDGYFGFQIPGSNKPKGEYMFEAVPGFNQHFGFMFGGATGVEIWRDCDRSLSWEVATNSRFWVQNTQTRSFDLKGRKWSRYMLLVDTQNGNALVPGINVLTRKMKVQPRYSFDINTGLVYDNDCGFRGEVGYNFYARQGERVTLKDDWDADRYAVAGLGAGFSVANNTATVLNRLSNIGDNNQDEDFAIADVGNQGKIRAQDLGLESAAAPCAISNLIYGSLGYHWDDRCYPLFISGGGSYEFSGKNTALNRWLGWVKFGVSI